MFTRQTFYCALLVNLLSGLLFLPKVQANVNAPAGVVAYYAITLTNNQVTATPTNFQQMLTVDWTVYGSNPNSTVTNVEFFTADGTILKAWCESNASSDSTSSIVWVNLGANTIPASGTLTIYIGFLDTGTNNMGNTGTSVWGEYPTATGTYAEYDNGANVFNNYWNFAGTSLSSGWNTGETVGATVNNGLSFRGANAGSGVSEGNAQQIEWNTAIARPFVLEDYASVGGTYVSLGLTYGDNLGSPISNGYGAYWATGYGWYLEDLGYWTSCNFTGGASNNLFPPVTSDHVWSFFAGPKGGTMQSQINYGGTLPTLTWTDTKCYDSGYVGMNTFWSDKWLYVTWARIRAYPPCCVMPAAVLSDLALAVEATAFRATADLRSVTLTWTTKTEVDNAGFNVLRKEPGSPIFKLIASFIHNDDLKGLGTSSVGKPYAFSDKSVSSGATYQYKVQSVSTSGEVKDLSTLTVAVGVPTNCSLCQNYPNPFNPATTISFAIPSRSRVSLKVFDVLGREISTIVAEELQAGSYTRQWNAAAFSSGVYFYRLEVGGFVQTRKLTVLK